MILPELIIKDFLDCLVHNNSIVPRVDLLGKEHDCSSTFLNSICNICNNGHSSKEVSVV